MVPILAKQAIQIKCGFDTSTIIGEYEMCYALGLLTAILDITVIEDWNQAGTLMEKIIPQLETYQTEDIRLKRLIRMVREATMHHSEEDADQDMKDLYRDGVEHIASGGVL